MAHELVERPFQRAILVPSARRSQAWPVVMFIECPQIAMCCVLSVVYEPRVALQICRPSDLQVLVVRSDMRQLDIGFSVSDIARALARVAPAVQWMAHKNGTFGGVRQAR